MAGLGDHLHDRIDRIVLGITGGIAAYKSAELVRLLVQDGVQGLLVEDATDESQLADALDRLLSDPERARRMGAAGRERAVRSYAWPVVVDKLEDLYERLGAPNS